MQTKIQMYYNLIRDVELHWMVDYILWQPYNRIIIASIMEELQHILLSHFIMCDVMEFQ